MMTLMKQQVRRAFNTATNTYDAAADWQKSVGEILLNYTDEIKPHHKTILDLGAGTAHLAHQIQQRYPTNQLFALDIAEGMLQFSKQHLKEGFFVCSDAENLGLKNHCVDMVVSNMVLHWCHSLKKTLQEQYRILKKEGVLLFSVLGPQSLQSLKVAWNCVDQYSHINHFPHAEMIRQACHTANFSLLRFEYHKIEKHYENVFELMHHLKATGAKNITSNKPKGLMGKQKIKTLSELYKNPLNYEIFTVMCRK